MARATVKQDILTALHGGMPERIPWTIYDFIFPRGQSERLLRSRGLGMVKPLPLVSPQIFHWGPNVEVAERTVVEGDQILRRIYYRTPVGELTELKRRGYAAGMAGTISEWHIEFMVKTPADYEILEFMIRDQVYSPNSEPLVQAQQEMGQDGVVMFRVGKVPFQLMWMEYTGIERLCNDLADDPGPAERVMQAMVERDRQVWMDAEQSSAELLSCSDNISGDVVSPKIFDRYFLPYYEALADVICLTKKPLVVHMDGLIHSLISRIERMPEGMVLEAFTPVPTGDCSVADVRAALGSRPIWINFPSSVHLCPPEEVEAVAQEILRQAAPGSGFLMGVTENMPTWCWPESMSAIGRAIDRYGACPLAT